MFVLISLYIVFLYVLIFVHNFALSVPVPTAMTLNLLNVLTFLSHFLCLTNVCVCVQECVFEEIEAKRSVFQVVESHVGEGVILSSSTSCLLPSNIFSQVQNRKRCIISHPVSTALPQTPRLCPIWHPIQGTTFGQNPAQHREQDAISNLHKLSFSLSEPELFMFAQGNDPSIPVVAFVTFTF